MRKLLIVLLLFISVISKGQGVLERTVKATEQLETGANFVYRTYDIPVLDITYHEFSSDNINWRKNYVNGDCYVRFSNTLTNTQAKHTNWWVYNICNQTSAGLDTIIVNYGSGQTQTLTAGDYTINMTMPATISGTSTNSQTTTSHTHQLQIRLNDNLDVNATPTDGQVLKYNAVSQQWEASNDLVLSGTGGGLRIKEEDGTPNVANVTEIRVPNAHLINNGSGSVSLVLDVNLIGGENKYWRTGTLTGTVGTNTITFSSPLPNNNYIVANAYAIFPDSTRQNLNYSNLTTNGFNVLGLVESSTIHYLAICDVDSLLEVQAEIGKVKASPTDPNFGYLSNKVDNATIAVQNYQLVSIADLADVTANGATTTRTITVGGLTTTGTVNSTNIIGTTATITNLVVTGTLSSTTLVGTNTGDQFLNGAGATLSGYTISLTGDSSPVVLPNEADGDPLNEIQNLGYNTASRTITIDKGGTGSVLPLATISDAGLMSSADKAVLDSISGRANVYTIKFPQAASVADRCSGVLSKPTGWTVAATGSGGIDLLITHNLGREVAHVTVWSIGVNGKRLLIGNMAYSGVIAPNNNTLTIESLATLAAPITVEIIFD